MRAFFHTTKGGVVIWWSVLFLVFLLHLLLVPPVFAGGEPSFSLGQTILNSLQDEKALAWSVDFRHILTSKSEWSLTYLNEGHPAGAPKRDGVAGELWLADDYKGGRWKLSAGTGPYLRFSTTPSVETYNYTEGSRVFTVTRSSYYEDAHRLAWLVSLSVARRLSRDIVVRGTWHRIVSGNNTDADVFLIGLGWSLSQ